MDRNEDTLRRYLADSQLESYLPVYYDRDRVNWRRYETDRTPSTFILDERGVIINKWTGPRDWNKMDEGSLKTVR